MEKDNDRDKGQMENDNIQNNIPTVQRWDDNENENENDMTICVD